MIISNNTTGKTKYRRKIKGREKVRGKKSSNKIMVVDYAHFLSQFI